MEDTRAVLKMVPVWHKVRVKKEVNYATHGLVKRAATHIIDQVLMEDIPSCIFYIVLLEPIIL